MIQEACGFKDSKGKFWDSLEEAEKAEKKYEYKSLELEVRNFLKEDTFYERDYYALNILTQRIMSQPEKVLSVLWKVTRYNFKQKFQDGK